MITYNNETLVITHHTPNKPPGYSVMQDSVVM